MSLYETSLSRISLCPNEFTLEICSPENEAYMLLIFPQDWFSRSFRTRLTALEVSFILMIEPFFKPEVTIEEKPKIFDSFSS